MGGALLGGAEVLLPIVLVERVGDIVNLETSYDIKIGN